MPRFSQRILSVEPSPTLVVSAAAKRLKAQGHDVISFAAGEPDFNTPQPIIDAAIKALNDGQTGYIASAGLPDLRAAIAENYKLRGRQLKAENIIVTVGAKQALFNAAQIFFEPGDIVLIPKPYWVSYPAQVLLAGATPQFIEPDKHFKITPEILRATLEKTPAAKGLILCSPCNPTGVAYTASELTALGDVLKDYPDVVIFFDAIYDYLSYAGGLAPDFVVCNSSLADRSVTFNGFSKTYAMTGWRIGYAIAEPEVIAKLTVIQSQSTSNATTFAQYGALAAIHTSSEELAAYTKTFQERRDLFCEKLAEIQGLSGKFSKPQGAFYIFVDFRDFIGEGKRFESCADLVQKLLENQYVAAVHGAAFGQPGFVRFSYTTSKDRIIEGIDRLKRFLES